MLLQKPRSRDFAKTKNLIVTRDCKVKPNEGFFLATALPQQLQGPARQPSGPRSPHLGARTSASVFFMAPSSRPGGKTKTATEQAMYSV